MDRIAKATEIIHGYEGLGGYNEKSDRFYPYQGKADKKGVITIGRGHVLNAGEIATQKYKNGLTIQEVNALFEADLEPRIKRLEIEMGKWTDNQFAGALSLFYNIEEPWQPGKTPYNAHRQGNEFACARGMLLYVYSDGKKRLGLWRRRMTEALCYLTGVVFVAKDPEREHQLETRLRTVLPGVVKPSGLC